MANILFICNLFGPANKMSAIRPTKLAKYISRHNNVAIDVVAQHESIDIANDVVLESDIKRSNLSIYYVSDGRITKLFHHLIKRKEISNNKKNDSSKSDYKIANNKKKKTHLNKLLKTIKDILYYSTNRIIAKDKAKQTIRFLKTVKKSYDYVITFGPNCSDYVGKYLKRTNQSIKWIADFRDPFYNPQTPFLFKNYAKNYAIRNVKKADFVVAVSPGYLKSLNISKKQKSAIISNGFDEEDLNYIISSNDKHKFSFLCVGELYKGKRRIDPFLKCLSELFFEKKIDPLDVEICYAGSSSAEFLRCISGYEMNVSIKDFGFIERKRSLILQSESFALLLPSWNDFDNQDIMPGKLLEFLMAKKPIIGVISGKCKNSYVKQVIDELKVGFCYEEADISAFENLKEYILFLYNCWKDNLVVINNTYSKVSEYSYKNISEKYYKLIVQMEE